MMKKLIVFYLIVFCTTYSYAVDGYVHVSKTQLVDGANKPLQLNAVNLGNWLLWEGWMMGGAFTPESQLKARLSELLGNEPASAFIRSYYDAYITEKDLARIKAKGYNSVRVPFNYRLFVSGADADGFEIIDRLVAGCKRQGIYVILDMHSAPGGQSPFFIADPQKPILWQSAEKQAQTIEIWKSIAQRYKNEKQIVGFDLLNEPKAPSVTVLTAFYKKLISTLRSVDKNHMLIIEGNNLAHDFKGFPPQLDANQIYSYHYYAWLSERNKTGGVNNIVKHIPGMAPIWCGEWGEDTKQNLAEVKLVLTALPRSCGTAFWSWKRVYKNNNRYPDVPITMPPAWRKVMNYLTWRSVRPDAQTAKAGTDAFLAAIRTP